jgi:alpha-galactosidase
MAMAQGISSSFADLYLLDGPEPVITYRSALVTYQESLSQGQFVGRSWSGSGYTQPNDLRLDPATHAAPQAFWVELEGQLLRSNWKWGGLTQRQCETGLEAVVELVHELRPVTIRVHTLLDGTPVLTRWLEITNTSDRSVPLAAAFPWSGVLQAAPHDDIPTTSPFSVGYMQDSHWGDEGHFDWRPLPYARCSIDGRYRRGRHRHPMFVLRNHLTGEHWIAQLAWSGGYTFEFDVDDGADRGPSRLWFRAGPDAPAPQRVLAPGETVTTPELHMGLVMGDLDEAIQAMHDHLRQSVLYPQPADRAGLIESGIGPEVEITPEEVNHNLEIAAEIGCEVFFIDASWYARPYGNWWSTVGDWQVNTDRFPGGIEPIRERVHQKGMLFGLWMDAERIGKESRIFEQHPEWMARRYDGKAELGGLIDLTKPEVAAWMEEQITKLIEGFQLDFYRLDYNVGTLQAGSCEETQGFVENGYWRYYEALYGVYKRLRERFPRVIFENCAGGGGRTDIGMVRYFNHTWVTDWQIAPRSFSITNGMTMALPPERIDRLGAGMGQWLHRTAELDFHCRLPLFVHPTMGWTHLIGAKPNPLQLARVKRQVEIYKTFVRPFHATSRIYHHTPVVSGLEPRGWGVLEIAARDRGRALVGLFRLSDPAEPEYLLRLRGLDMGRRYQVTFDNSGDKVVLDGYTLVKAGVPIRLETALTSELLLVEAVE